MSVKERVHMLQTDSHRGSLGPVDGGTMEDEPKVLSSQLSRRSLLRNVGFAASGVAMLVTTVTANRAEAKAAQKLVAYQDTPKGAQRCDNCSQFEPPSSCKVVEGDNISPAGWCKVYVKKAAG
jgi:high potential iron-sulfur protein